MATIQKTDIQIRDDVLAEMRWDTRVVPTEIGVEVKNRVVTLTGAVDSWGRKMAAAAAAHRVVGVLDVANDVMVRVPGSAKKSDSEVAEQTRNALKWDVFVPDEKVRTTVTNGLVTLQGEVDFWSQRDSAERAVRNLAGVTAVQNDLVVSNAHLDDDVRRAVQNALARHAEREARNVKVRFDGKRVFVDGNVGSWSERNAVLGAVRGTRGVGPVEDHLSVT
jgi:osmotically-inducible protein OsmY